MTPGESNKVKPGQYFVTEDVCDTDTCFLLS